MTFIIHILLLFLSLTSFAFARDDDEDEDRDWDEYYYSEGQISYGGISFPCDSGCADWKNPDLREVDSLFETLVDKTICERGRSDPYGLYNERGVWKYDDEWAYVSELSYESYPWLSTGGLHQEGVHLVGHSFDTYDHFNNTKTVFLRDLDYYHIQLIAHIESEIELKKQNLALLKEALKNDHTFVEYDWEGKVENCHSYNGYNCFLIRNELERIPKKIQWLIDDIQKEEEHHQKNLDLCSRTFSQIDALFRETFLYCLNNHQPEGIAFNAALENFLLGDFNEAIEQIRFLIDLAEKNSWQNGLISKLYLLQGQIQGEFNFYGDAIVSLTQSIQKDPSLKEAYLERAVAYFETGETDLALKDYLEQRNTEDLKPAELTDYLDFAAGFRSGIKHGAWEYTKETFSTALSSVHGIGNFVWATLQHPIETPRQLICSAIELCQSLANCSPLEIAQIVVPELRELLGTWNQQSYARRGELFGQIAGKYGLELYIIYATKQGGHCLAHLKDLKRAEKIATMESLTDEARRVATIEASTHWAQKRAQYFASVKLEVDKQGKHIIGHHNFDPRKTKSIWTHENPEEFLSAFAGKGRRVKGEPGQPGYKEKVNFGQKIGYHVDEKGAKTETTWGIIHYSKKGAHIVPELPDIY